MLGGTDGKQEGEVRAKQGSAAAFSLLLPILLLRMFFPSLASGSSPSARRLKLQRRFKDHLIGIPLGFSNLYTDSWSLPHGF